MIFQHTIDSVLDGTKTQTSRVWKANYGRVIEADNNITVFSKTTGRKLYYVGQNHAVQPARGKKGVARVGLSSVGFQDVRSFTHDDIKREGFQSKQEFLDLWQQMHGNNYDALVIRFKLAKA